MARRRTGTVLEQYLQSLPRDERLDMESLVVVLVDEIKARPGMERRHFGEREAVEIIWAIGRYLNSPLSQRGRLLCTTNQN
ncbi:MAG: hypothetical protein KJ063_02545 [Anaerolineae bacterium]|nr:hypothetical protein [Anaerolineae bacterium]